MVRHFRRITCFPVKRIINELITRRRKRRLFAPISKTIHRKMIDIYSYYFIYRKKHADNISRRQELFTTLSRVGKHFFLSHAVLSWRVTLVVCVTTFFLRASFSCRNVRSRNLSPILWVQVRRFVLKIILKALFSNRSKKIAILLRAGSPYGRTVTVGKIVTLYSFKRMAGPKKRRKSV